MPEYTCIAQLVGYGQGNVSSSNLEQSKYGWRCSSNIPCKCYTNTSLAAARSEYILA